MALEAGRGRLSLQVDYVPLAAQASAQWDGVLGVATFERGALAGGASARGALAGGASARAASARAAHPAPLAAGDIPVVEIRTPVLGSSGEICEVWRTRQRVESGQRSRIQYRRGEDVLFGCISMPETEHQNGDLSALHTATDQAYREIFATLDELAYPHLLRVWNYLPQINVDTHGTERYRQFNSARRRALIASGRELTGNVPAACALGSVTGSPLVIYFLASREAPTVIENPRQVSAYEYPPQYGPKPAFSRASVLHETSGAILFVSGTASIVGHQTVHAGDVAAQTRETLVNIEALLGEANRVSGATRFGLETLAYKVYVRNSSDLPLIQSQLHGALGRNPRVVYLQADICRQDLLVEIEAIGREHDCD
jgi:chorismate lyase / 3-hydroxybenzoate synthase